MVREKTHVPDIMSSNPGTLNWMDIFSHLFVVKICVFERTKINEKEAGVGPFKKHRYDFCPLVNESYRA